MKNILDFFPKSNENQSSSKIASSSNVDVPIIENQYVSKPTRVEVKDIDTSAPERDPGLCLPITTNPVNCHDDVRRAYVIMGPCQSKLKEYKPTLIGKQNRQFNYSWFSKFSWLEYSVEKDRVNCFPCFLFDSILSKNPTFISQRFNSWKRVHDGEKCAFANHKRSCLFST